MWLKTPLLAITVSALSATSAALFAQQNSAPTAPGPTKEERLICRSSVEIGSLAKRRRQCFTKAEWDRLAEGARKQTTRMLTDNPGMMQGN